MAEPSTNGVSKGRRVLSSLVPGFLARKEDEEEPDVSLSAEELDLLLSILDAAELRIRARQMPHLVTVIMKIQEQRKLIRSEEIPGG